MSDLRDGESAEVQGSGRSTYVLKNIGGVYSCTCPAWRNQSLPIERRTCKHLRQYRGEANEAARIGGAPTTAANNPAVESTKAPGVLLAETWDGEQDVSGWWLSEKLDGVRAVWTGRQFLSRQGNVFHAPTWFTADLPEFPLDGELWLARRAFQRTVAIVRRHDQTSDWQKIRYVVFDAPAEHAPFERRLKKCREHFNHSPALYVDVLEQSVCRGRDHLDRELDRIESLGGEGIMLRRPDSLYEAGRSSSLLKVKRFLDAEALVVDHEPGKGRHRGRLGALICEVPGGLRFAVGSGLTDAERDRPPAIGSIINFRYQELTERGVPRFPTYVRLRTDVAAAGKVVRSPAAFTFSPYLWSYAMTRRFEFVGGSSAKFWEVNVVCCDVTIRYGRIGTAGQSFTKPFPDPAAARKHVEKLVAEKTAKGYVETAMA